MESKATNKYIKEHFYQLKQKQLIINFTSLSNFIPLTINHFNFTIKFLMQTLVH
jgi:hypothetical protein